MGKLRRSANGILYTALSLSVALFLLFVIVQIEQHVLRRQAEHLLVDIQSIDLRHTTFDQATAMLSHWNGSVAYALPCSKQHCSFSILPHGLLSTEFYKYLHQYRAVTKLYTFLGGVFGGAYATFVVRNGFVWDEEYSLREYSGEGDIIGADISTTGIGIDPRFEEQHPDYQVHLGQPFSVFLVSLSSYASPQEIRQLMQFDFSCLTRWLHPCQSQQDIVPALAAEFVKAQEVSLHRANEKLTCNAQDVRIAARDSDGVGVVEVVNNRPTPLKYAFPNANRVLTVRLRQRLKYADSWPLGTDRDLPVSDSSGVRHLSDVAAVRSGERLILETIIGDPASEKLFERGPCTVVLDTQANLATVELGIRQDERIPPLEEYDKRRRYRLYSATPDLPEGWWYKSR